MLQNYVFQTYVYNLNMKHMGNKNSVRIVTLSDLGAKKINIYNIKNSKIKDKERKKERDNS